MSEWGIPNVSTFGGGGGCFISILSLLGGIFLVALFTKQVSFSNTATTDTVVVTDTIPFYEESICDSIYEVEMYSKEKLEDEQ